MITTYLEPHVQLLSKKGVEAYEASKNAITHHVIKAQECADPYFQVNLLLYCSCLFVLSTFSLKGTSWMAGCQEAQQAIH